MKLYTADQIKLWDELSIEAQGITSLELMERASKSFVDWFMQETDCADKLVHVICGPGNNGGDGLAIARMLHQNFFEVRVYRLSPDGHFSKDNEENFDRLPTRTEIFAGNISDAEDFPPIDKSDVVIDAILGIGVNRPLDAIIADFVFYINNSGAKVYSVDIPSGLFPEQHTSHPAIKASKTVTFGIPKISFFYKENQAHLGEWTSLSIGLDKSYNNKTDIYLIDHTFISNLINRRSRFDHKGTFGHALLICGSKGMMGAALLSGKASLRSGVGLLSIHCPSNGSNIIQIGLPEAIVSEDRHATCFSEVPNLSNFDAIGIGCGLGQNNISLQAFELMLEQCKEPLVIDADGLNLISWNKTLLQKIPLNSILTPHPKEFERLFGPSESSFERQNKQRTLSKELGVYIVLKEAYTKISCPDGSLYINTSGNPGMATAGSGDVLTGIITGLLAQSYSPKESALIAVFIHGTAGDIANSEYDESALIASDIIGKLGAAFKSVSDAE